MALFSECTVKYVSKLLDTADIVRDAMLRQLRWNGTRRMGQCGNGDGSCVGWQAKRDSGQPVGNEHRPLVDVPIFARIVRFFHVLEYNYNRAIFGIAEDHRRESANPTLVPDQTSSEPFRERPAEAVFMM